MAGASPHGRVTELRKEPLATTMWGCSRCRRRCVCGRACQHRAFKGAARTVGRTAVPVSPLPRPTATRLGQAGRDKVGTRRDVMGKEVDAGVGHEGMERDMVGIG